MVREGMEQRDHGVGNQRFARLLLPVRILLATTTLHGVVSMAGVPRFPPCTSLIPRSCISAGITLSSSMDTKRRTRQQPPVRDSQTELLAMLGMRIRKAVSDGYSTGDHYDGLTHTAPASQGFSRMPLPAHMDQPPSLMGAGSTMDSSSSLSGWENRIYAQPLQVIDNVSHGKRKAEETPDLGTYRQRYGELAFDEEF